VPSSIPGSESPALLAEARVFAQAVTAECKAWERVPAPGCFPGAMNRRPAFGDYAIAPPDPFQGDMRPIKPSATVRYATERGWLIAKGPNVRDNGFGQYWEWCRSVVEPAGYLGRAFSTGSDNIDKSTPASQAPAIS
jgi:Beta protein